MDDGEYFSSYISGAIWWPPRFVYNHALLNLLHNWYKALEKLKTLIRVLFLDFSKAFDLINHNKLLQDMKTMGSPYIVDCLVLKGKKTEN